MTKAHRHHIRVSDVPPYSPANHQRTENRRLIGPESVGAQRMEVVLGVLAKGGAALPHAHPGIEQACYLLEGAARAEVAGEAFDMVPGEMCFFPADLEHAFVVTSETPVKVLVIYSPPYVESPQGVVRRAR
jgi:quercetin dioxygenase-like cupin family protein